MKAIQIYDARQNRVVTVEKIEKSDAEWKRLLTKKQYEITTRKETEAPGSCLFNEVHEPGIFQCVRCDTDKVRSMSFKEMNNYNRDGSGAWFCLCKLTFLIGEKLSDVDLEVNYQLAEG